MISGVFILITLSSQVGQAYFAMAAVYAIAMNQNGASVFQFSRSNKTITGKAILSGFALIGGLVAISALVLGSQEAFIAASTAFASEFANVFTIDNSLIKLIVFGFFVPVVETLFFYGVIFKFISEKANAQMRLTDVNTLVAIGMTSGIATSFHFAVRLLNDQSLLVDLIFFTVSGILVVIQKEMSGAAAGHIFANSSFILKILGWLKF